MDTSTVTIDIDQLCHLIDDSTFGLKSISSTKFSSIPSYQIKIFRSSRLKRLHCSTIQTENTPCLSSTHRSTTMRLSLPASLLNRFRSLSTSNLPSFRQHSPPPASSSRRTLFATNTIECSSTIESSEPSAHLSKRRSSTNSCNVDELAAYFDDFLYLPKSLSGAAELMYT